MPRLQFTIRAFLVLMFGCACFFAGVRFGWELERPEDIEAIMSEAERAAVRAEEMGAEARAQHEKPIRQMSPASSASTSTDSGTQE